MGSKTFRKGGIMGLFKGKETYKEELAEGKAVKSGKLSPAQYAKAEGKESYKEELTEGKALKSGKTSPEKYAKKEGTEKKMASGGTALKKYRFAKGGTVKGYLVGGLLDGMKNSGAFNATAGPAVQPIGSTGTTGFGGDGGGAQGGLDQVNKGSSQIGQSLGTIAGALGTGTRGSQGPSSSLMPYADMMQTAFKKGGKVKMAMGGPMDPRMAMMAKKKAPRGVAPARGMMPPMAAPQVAPTMPMKKGGKVKGQSPIQTKAKGGAKIVKMAKGGLTSSRGDGCAIRGKTRA